MRKNVVPEILRISVYSRTRIKETFGYEKRFNFSTFMQDKLSTLIRQVIKETVNKRNCE